VLFSALHGIGGLKAVALLAGVVVCGAATLLFCHMLWSTGNIFLALLGALLAHGAATVHFLARPHVFTLFLLAASLWLLARDRAQPGWRIWLLVPITAVWVNLHGGFLAILVCLGLAAAGSALEWFFGEGERSRFYTLRYSILTGLCSLATLINPYGYRLHVHIVDYLQSSFIKDWIQEFQSPSFRGENMLQYELLLFAGLAVVGVLLTRKRFVEALMILFWAQASLGSVRHVPLFVIVATPILVQQISQVWNEWSRDKSRKSLGGIMRDLAAEFSVGAVRVTFWAPLVIAALAVSMSSAKGDIWSDDFPKAKFPVAMVNLYAGQLAPVAGHMPRIFASDQWGDYLTYRFYPRIRIFVDGRSDLYGDTLGKEYIHTSGGRWDWEPVLDRYRIDMVLVPVEWPLAELLKRNAGWRLLKDDGFAILFDRRSPVLMKSADSAERITSTTRSAVP
jgi:hypothetical protein